MGGYRRPAKVYKLVFADDDMAGLEVRARSVPLGSFLDLLSLAAIRGARNLDPSQLKDVDKLFSAFAGALMSWNLVDDDDQPVPADLDGVKTLDMDFALQIVMAWIDAIASVSAPLGQNSPSGAPPAGLDSLPMVPL